MDPLAPARSGLPVEARAASTPAKPGAPAASGAQAQSDNSTATPALTPGSVLDVRVLAALDAGRFLIALGDRTLVAAGPPNLKPGSTIRVAVASGEGGVPVLRLDPAVSASTSLPADRLAAVGLPPTPLAAQVLAAFEEAGAPLDPRRLATALAAAQQPDATPDTAAAHAQLALARLPATPALTALALRAVAGGLPDLGSALARLAHVIEQTPAEQPVNAAPTAPASGGRPSTASVPATPLPPIPANPPPPVPPAAAKIPRSDVALPGRTALASSTVDVRIALADPPTATATTAPAATPMTPRPTLPAAPAPRPAISQPSPASAAAPTALPAAAAAPPTPAATPPAQTAPVAVLTPVAPAVTSDATQVARLPAVPAPVATPPSPIAIAPETVPAHADQPPPLGPTLAAAMTSWRPAPTATASAQPRTGPRPVAQSPAEPTSTTKPAEPPSAPTTETASPTAAPAARSTSAPLAIAVPAPIAIRTAPTVQTAPAAQTPAPATPPATPTTLDPMRVLAGLLPQDPGRDGVVAVLRALAMAGVRPAADEVTARPLAAPPDRATPSPTAPAHATPPPAAAAPVPPAAAPPSAAARESSPPPAPDAPLPLATDALDAATTQTVREHLATQVFKPRELGDYDRVVALPLMAQQMPTPARLAVAQRRTGGGQEATFVRVDAELTRLGPVSIRLSGIAGAPLTITVLADPSAGRALAEDLPTLIDDLRALGIEAGVRVATDGGADG